MEKIQAITAVHHPMRRRIVEYLGLYGASQVTVIARALDQQVGSISHHLRMLERAELVERTDDPDGDRRTSWWQRSNRSISWSVDDFKDSPADAMLAREAERVNTVTHFQRLQDWRRRAGTMPEWTREAFSSDTLTWATPAELSALSDALIQTMRSWQQNIDTDDGARRQPVFVFAHGFPTTP